MMLRIANSQPIHGFTNGKKQRNGNMVLNKFGLTEVIERNFLN